MLIGLKGTLTDVLAVIHGECVHGYEGRTLGKGGIIENARKRTGRSTFPFILLVMEIMPNKLFMFIICTKTIRNSFPYSLNEFVTFTFMCQYMIMIACISPSLACLLYFITLLFFFVPFYFTS